MKKEMCSPFLNVSLKTNPVILDDFLCLTEVLFLFFAVTDSSHFKDDDSLLYQFKIDFRRELTLLDLVIPPESESDEEVPTPFILPPFPLPSFYYTHLHLYPQGLSVLTCNFFCRL